MRTALQPVAPLFAFKIVLDCQLGQARFHCRSKEAHPGLLQNRLTALQVQEDDSSSACSRQLC